MCLQVLLDLKSFGFCLGGVGLENQEELLEALEALPTALDLLLDLGQLVGAKLHVLALLEVAEEALQLVAEVSGLLDDQVLERGHYYYLSKMSTAPIRAVLRKEQNIPINHLYDAAKLREFTSNYKRHTIKRIIRPRSQLPTNLDGVPLSERVRASNPADYFQVYCRVVIPQIEAATEERLLH